MLDKYSPVSLGKIFEKLSVKGITYIETYYSIIVVLNYKYFSREKVLCPQIYIYIIYICDIYIILGYRHNIGIYINNVMLFCILLSVGIDVERVLALGGS